MSTRLFRILVSLAGIIGVAMLGIYYSTVLIPPQLLNGTATATQMKMLAVQYRSTIFLDAWLQGTGALLSVVFFVALVHIADATHRFAGWMTMLASGIILAVGLSEGTFTFATVQPVAIGQSETAIVSSNIITVFGHVFLAVPAPFLFLSLAGVLLGSRVLPRAFGYLALALGITFEILGFAGLFSTLAGALSTYLLIGQELWIIAVAITLIVRTGKVSNIAASKEQ